MRDYIERLQMKIVWMLPNWVVYWAAIRMGSYASSKFGDIEVGKLGFLDVVGKWGEDFIG